MKEKRETRNSCTRGIEVCGKVFTSMAGVFSTMACCGKLYEIKVPEKLRK